MADMGYLGEPYHLLVPNKYPQTPADFYWNGRIHSIRQVVERANKRIKDFAMFKQTYRSSSYDVHCKCFRIACVFVDFVFGYY